MFLYHLLTELSCWCPSSGCSAFAVNWKISFKCLRLYITFWKVNRPIYKGHKMMTQLLSFPAFQPIISMKCTVTIDNALPRFHVSEASTRDGGHMVSHARSNNWVSYKRYCKFHSHFKASICILLTWKLVGSLFPSSNTINNLKKTLYGKLTHIMAVFVISAVLTQWVLQETLAQCTKLTEHTFRLL
jgi:hypothetical protein